MSKGHNEILTVVVYEIWHHFFLDDDFQILETLDDPDKALTPSVSTFFQ